MALTGLLKMLTRRSRSIRARQATPQKQGAVAYFRVSTADQLENASIDTQRERCYAYCRAKGYTILEEFQEARSGFTDSNRPEFERMIDYCKRHHRKIGIVVVFNSSRFARSVEDSTTYTGILRGLGVDVHSEQQGFDSSNAGWLQSIFQSVMDEYHSREKSARTLVARDHALKSGKWPHQSPIGYLDNPQDHGILLHDPIRAPLIRQAFEMFAMGYTKKEILDKLGSDVTMPRTGQKLSAQTLNKILENPLYAGWTGTQEWGLPLKGAFPAIISEELFTNVGNILSSGNTKERQVRSKHSEDFPLRSFIRCGACGTPITGSSSTGRAGRKYPFYACPRKGCRAAKFKPDDLHQRFIELLYNLRPQEQYLKLFYAVVTDVWRAKHADREKELAKLIISKSDLEVRLQRVTDLFIEGQFTAEEHRTQKTRLGTALQEAESQLAKAAPLKQELESLLEFSDWLLARVAGIWNTARLENKMRLQTVLFPEGLVVSSAGFGTAKHPLFLDTSTTELYDSNDVASHVMANWNPLLDRLRAIAKLKDLKATFEKAPIQAFARGASNP